MLDLFPMGDLCVIKQDEFKSKTGLILTEGAKYGSMQIYQGTIMEVGDAVSTVGIGDKVLFAKFGKSDITRPAPGQPGEPETFCLVYERDINCLVVDSPNKLVPFLKRQKYTDQEVSDITARYSVYLDAKKEI